MRKNYKREYLSEAARGRRRSQRIEEMKRQKRRQERIRRLAVPVGIGLLVCIVLIIVVARGLAVRARRRENPNNTYIEQARQPQGQQEKQTQPSDGQMPEQSEEQPAEQEVPQTEDVAMELQSAYAGGIMGRTGVDSAEKLLEDYRNRPSWLARANPPLSAVTTEQTLALGDSIVSENAVFINASEGTVLAQKDAWTRIPPASMTKILTVLVAAEHVTDMEDTFTMTKTALKYGRDRGCTAVGFVEGEKVALRDLFYGTVLHSGADAAVGLAEYIAGSHEAFVELMNEKLEQLGVSDTAHFTNCVGVHDTNHYCTVYDMSVILKAAYDNPFCREVLSAHTYTTGITPQHPEGIEISNWFLRRIEDKDTHGEVLCGKTGYVDASGNCAASLLVGSDGTVYICATVHATSKWRCIEDHTALYQRFVP